MNEFDGIDEGYLDVSEGAGEVIHGWGDGVSSDFTGA